jgi:FlaG/FlaF family flagellin (archaellin)
VNRKGISSLLGKLAVALVIVLSDPVIASGKVIYVDDDGVADFNNIQAAIDDANDGDTIVVVDGTYTGEGNRDIGFLGKAITVRSENGPANCIIDVKATQSDWHNAFYLNEGENKRSTIDGFTITGGHAYMGGGIECRNSSPTIKNCIITKNTAGWGGGIMLRESNASVINCIISQNRGWDAAGGIYNSYYSITTINSCTITGNKASDVGGILCSGSKASVNNCVLWANRSWYESEVRLQYDSSISISYCDITGGESSVYVDETSTLYWGQGNIDADPCFGEPGYWDPNGTPGDANDDVWMDGDYHLKSQAGRWEPNSESWVVDDVTSPCIDAGDPLSPIGLEPFPNGGRVNMGAHGGTVEASKSYFGQPVCETIVAGDINGDCIVNFKDFALMALHWLEDSNIGRYCIVEGDVKYCIRTDKSVYHLGETVGIFYSITNLGSLPVSLGWAPIRPFCYRFVIVDENGEHVWLWSWEMPPIPPVEFILDAYESEEYEIGWDMINDNGTYETEDDFPAGPGMYKITGELLAGEEEDRVRVSVYVNVRE